MELKPTYTILGKKLSEWLELAIADMQELAKVDGVDFDMRDWVTLTKSAEDPKEVCFLCLAGCAIYKGRLLPKSEQPIGLLIKEMQSHIHTTGLEHYGIEVVDPCAFLPSSRNLLLFFNSARKGLIDVSALKEACLTPAPNSAICWEGAICWEVYFSAETALAERGFPTSDGVGFGSDFSSDHAVVACSARLNVPEGVDRKAAYADHVKEKLQPLLNALKEIGL
jgi:hypothetical protein